jgi:hypothetical protein
LIKTIYDLTVFAAARLIFHGQIKKVPSTDGYLKTDDGPIWVIAGWKGLTDAFEEGHQHQFASCALEAHLLEPKTVGE